MRSPRRSLALGFCVRSVWPLLSLAVPDAELARRDCDSDCAFTLNIEQRTAKAALRSSAFCARLGDESRTILTHKLWRATIGNGFSAGPTEPVQIIEARSLGDFPPRPRSSSRHR